MELGAGHPREGTGQMVGGAGQKGPKIDCADVKMSCTKVNIQMNTFTVSLRKERGEKRNGHSEGVGGRKAPSKGGRETWVSCQEKGGETSCRRR